MDLLSIFRSDEDGLRRSQVKNLVSVAMADGHLDADEWELLKAIARVIGITEEEIRKIQQFPETVKFIAPRKYEEKVQHLQDLVAVMTIDGEINQRELDLCKKISIKLDLLPQLVDDIIADMLLPGTARQSGE